MSKHITAIIFGIAIVLAAVLLGNAYVDRSKIEGTIRVTGLGTKDFTSDLIVWEAQFTAASPNLQNAYSLLKVDQQKVQNYLVAKGVSLDDMVFSAVQKGEQNKNLYADNGTYVGVQFVAHELRQTVQIESKDVNNIEKIAREATELYDQGISLNSYAPRYYFTKLADLKIEMISKATEDARVRAETIAQNAGGSLGDLQSATMGIFQITGQNSQEEYSWGGTFNTASKEKTASITMKLIYSTD